MPHLWHDLDLSSAKQAVSKKFISTSIRCSRGAFKTATLKSFPEQTPLNEVYYLSRRFSQLRCLHCMDNSIKYDATSLSAQLKMTSNLTTIIVGKMAAAISVKNAVYILDHHDLLTTAEFHDISGRAWEWSDVLDKVYPKLRNVLLGHGLVRMTMSMTVVGTCLFWSNAPLITS